MLTPASVHVVRSSFPEELTGRYLPVQLGGFLCVRI